eukprot:1139715-Pelagomonas_calceolata.AAC.3
MEWTVRNPKSSLSKACGRGSAEGCCEDVLRNILELVVSSRLAFLVVSSRLNFQVCFSQLKRCRPCHNKLWLD